MFPTEQGDLHPGLHILPPLGADRYHERNESHSPLPWFVDELIRITPRPFSDRIASRLDVIPAQFLHYLGDDAHAETQQLGDRLGNQRVRPILLLDLT
jgi:hypothetical protein